jgi:hypothetical protein
VSGDIIVRMIIGDRDLSPSGALSDSNPEATGIHLSNMPIDQTSEILLVNTSPLTRIRRPADISNGRSRQFEAKTGQLPVNVNA